jgi:hypothetical protein
MSNSAIALFLPANSQDGRSTGFCDRNFIYAPEISDFSKAISS